MVSELQLVRSRWRVTGLVTLKIRSDPCKRLHEGSLFPSTLRRTHTRAHTQASTFRRSLGSSASVPLPHFSALTTKAVWSDCCIWEITEHVSPDYKNHTFWHVIAMVQIMRRADSQVTAKSSPWRGPLFIPWRASACWGPISTVISSLGQDFTSTSPGRTQDSTWLALPVAASPTQTCLDTYRPSSSQKRILADDAAPTLRSLLLSLYA